MLLTDAERQKFIEYLRLGIMSEKQLIGQLEKMSMKPLADRKRQLCIAYELVLRDLLSIATERIGGMDSP